MRLAIFAAVVLGLIWIGVDPKAQRMASSEIIELKHGLLGLTCPPSNGSWPCHIMAQVLD